MPIVLLISALTSQLPLDGSLLGAVSLLARTDFAAQKISAGDAPIQALPTRLAYFLGANDPNKALKTTLKTEVDAEAWATLNSDASRPFAKPKTGRIAMKVVNHLGDEVMKVFGVS